MQILVLGAGVSGLSSGILLLKKGYEVTIWAKDLPPNTTSNKAAAFWYPYLCNPKNKATQWGKITLNYLKREILNDPQSGCLTRTITEVFEKEVEEPWWKDAVEEYRRPKKNELPQGYVDGYQVEGVLMDTTIYMDYLVNKFKELGGVIVQKTVANIREPLQNYQIVVNCTGLGSRELFHDDTVYPIRGQMVKVKSNGFDQVIADDEGRNSLAVIIPRLHDIMLGGTTQKNDWNLDIDPKDTQEILKKCAALNPIFENVEIIGQSVGLRPARPEIRVEIEKFGSKTVVHNYGHGGSGFTLSWGCAQDVVDLVDKAVN